jgi:hypothetical protein
MERLPEILATRVFEKVTEKFTPEEFPLGVVDLLARLKLSKTGFMQLLNSVRLN